MASLIVGAGLLLSEKIRGDKAKRKEKKRKAYETRYNELEKEHKSYEEKSLERRKTGESSLTPVDPAQQNRRSNSMDSQASRKSADDRDNPARWVDDALKERQRQRQSTG